MKKQELKINVPIPDGMVLKSVRSEIKDGVVVVIPEYKEKPKYKDGDILALSDGGVLIYDPDNSKSHWTIGNNYYAAIRSNSSLSIQDRKHPYSYFGSYNDIRGLATEEEKQRLFKVLAQNGYRWNAEKKVVEKALPRALKGGKYFHISRAFQIIEFIEEHTSMDNSLYESGNYFLAKEEAEKYAIKFREMIKNRTL